MLTQGYPSLLTAQLLLQARSRGVHPSECLELSDVIDLSAAVLRQHDMLDAFEEVAAPKLNTWVVARATANTAQSAAITQLASNLAGTSITPIQLTAEDVASAIAAAPYAAATPSACDGGMEASKHSAQNKRSHAKVMQAVMGGSSRAMDADKQAGQVLLLGSVMHVLCWYD